MVKDKVDTGLVAAALTDVFESFKSSLNGAGKVAYWEVIVGKINAADGSGTWGYRYPQSVLNGTVVPSQRFAKAVMALAASLDGMPVEIARSEQVMVMVEPGRVREGAYVMGASRVCARPGCPVVFVPNHPRRRYCPVCRPPVS